METRVCRGCGSELPATTQYFYRADDKPGGLTYKCKSCRNIEGQKYTKAYRARQRDGVAVAKDPRRVFALHYGPIEKGFEIHHLDGNPSNNAIENLVKLTPTEHKRMHAGWEQIGGEWYKPCSRCKELKHVSNFSEHIKGSGRYQSKCKACANKYPEKVCPECGKTYTPCYAKQQTCSTTCSGSYRSKRGRETVS